MSAWDLMATRLLVVQANTYNSSFLPGSSTLPQRSVLVAMRFTSINFLELETRQLSRLRLEAPEPIAMQLLPALRLR